MSWELSWERLAHVFLFVATVILFIFLCLPSQVNDCLDVLWITSQLERLKIFRQQSYFFFLIIIGKGGALIFLRNKREIS